MAGKMSRVRFAPVGVDKVETPDDGFILRAQAGLGDYPDTLCHHVEHQAATTPDRDFLAERADDGAWRRITYGGFRDTARAVAAGLLTRGIGADSPVMLLSDNGIDNALMQFGAMYAGIPAAPVSPAYSLMSQDHAKLRFIFDLLKPKLVFAENGAAFAAALSVLDLDGVEVVLSRNPPDGVTATAFSDFCQTEEGPEVAAACAALGAGTTAKILFTSGSTGFPKGVINTHGMMCSNQQAMAQVWPFLEDRPPVLLDWLPWHHTFGGNHNLNMVLRNGGTLYIDAGKPAPGLIDTTIQNLHEVQPTLYFNVPRGFDMVLPYLEADPDLAANLFAELDLIFYAAAALPQSLWERLETLSAGVGTRDVVMTTSWGATETAPAVTSAHFPLDGAGNIGVPLPGCELKFLPNGTKLEMRVRGPNVTPGYFGRSDLTEEAFDEDGFYRIGDAGKPVDPADPAKGVFFDGRVSEDFKLLTGSWVSVGTLRVAAIAACTPVIQDAVVTGHDRDDIGLLIFPNPAGCAEVAGMDAAAPLAELVHAPAVREFLRERLGAYNEANPASSTKIAQVLMMTAPPTIDSGEITDKGYINQRAVIECRGELIERLYDPAGDPDVVVVA